MCVLVYIIRYCMCVLYCSCMEERLCRILELKYKSNQIKSDIAIVCVCVWVYLFVYICPYVCISVLLAEHACGTIVMSIRLASHLTPLFIYI